MLNTNKQEYIHLFGDYLAKSETSLMETFTVGLPVRIRDFQGVVHPVCARCLPMMEVNPSPGSPSCRCPKFEQVNPMHRACRKLCVNPQLLGMGQVVNTLSGVVLGWSKGHLQQRRGLL